MMSKVKDLLAAGENLEEISRKVKAVSKDVSEQSKEFSELKTQLSEVKADVKKIGTDVSKLSSSLAETLDDFSKTNEGFKKELYEFKMIKSDIKSKLVDELLDSFREELRKGTGKLDTDVKGFNALKDELSHLVSKFKSVEGEIEKFKAIAQEVKSADFQLSRHAKELAAADSEKLKLMQQIDQLERLVSKIRRGS